MSNYQKHRTTPDAIKARAMANEPTVLYSWFNNQFSIIKTVAGYDILDKDGYGLELHECFSWMSCLDDSIGYSHFELHHPYALRGRRVKLQSLSYFMQSFILADYIESYPQFKPLLAHTRRLHQAILDLKHDLKWHRFPHMIHYAEFQIGV